MSFRAQLAHAERVNRSLLCVGLDPDPSRFPGAMKNDPAQIFDFCSAIVDATRDLVIAYKPQIAYFAAHGAEAQLERLIAYIHDSAPDVPVILDAKRGDMGSTAEQYAKEVFDRYRADAVTLSPLLGFDSIEPYLRHAGKGVILLCRTSNPGGADLQDLRLASGEKLYEHIATLATTEWNRGGEIGLVVYFALAIESLYPFPVIRGRNSQAPYTLAVDTIRRTASRLRGPLAKAVRHSAALTPATSP